MTEKELKEAAERCAKAISIQMEAFVQRGFTQEQAHQLCCSMLSSSVVYTPFAGMAMETDHATTRH